MQTIWGLFKEYAQAKTAVAELELNEFPAAEINAIVQVMIAKDQMPVDLNKIRVAVAGQFGGALLRGLDRLVGGEEPVPVADVGQVSAAGELATLLVKAAIAPRATDGSRKGALVEFGVPAA